jgi:cysteinylglycine-S-conjugate dipeptidase
MNDHAMIDGFVSRLSPFIQAAPTTQFPRKRDQVAQDMSDWLIELGFTTQRIRAKGAADIIVAYREGEGERCVGLSGHYDVEEAGDGWDFEPFQLTQEGGRIFGRGVADNLGPLVLRLMSLEAHRGRAPSLLWVLQGEEEIGSPFAHRHYPDLKLPRVDLWIEETGYFELDGTQRLLARRVNDFAQPILRAISEDARAQGRSVEVHDRYMNKAFGEQKCPFLTHLVGDAPYLAVGPNDPHSMIHRPNESLSTTHLALSAQQFISILETSARPSPRPAI